MEMIMHTSTRLVVLRLGAALLLCGLIASPQAEDTRPECAVRVASGPAGKVYELMVRDVQSVCGATVMACSVSSRGGLQNLSLLSANEADLGIVQVDTLRDMKGGDENIGTLQAVMPLHANLLHVVTLAGGSVVGVKTVMGSPVPYTGRTVVLGKFSALKGMAVAVVGSAQLMGQTLEKQLGYGMTFVVADSDDEALSLLRAGQVQAVFTLGGWPLPSIARLKVNSGLLLAEYDLTPQAPYVAVKRSYQSLDVFNRTFLAVPNLLVTRPFKAGGAMGSRVAALQSCLRQHLDELQEGRYQASWKEIKDLNNVYGWTSFVPGTGAPSGRLRSARAER
jgi:TRAP-type uncharacterized transport system substrate-binding protein